MTNQQKVLICITCVKHNHNKTFPVVCPRMKMPCMAIDPKYIQLGTPNPIEKLAPGINSEGRVTTPYIDPSFVQTMLKNFETLKAKGITPSCTHF